MEESFGPYQICGAIGGDVYRAVDTTTDRVVALKLLPANATDNPAFEQRFRRDAHVAAELADPHIIRIHSYGEIDGRLYLDMRLIYGRDLGALLDNAAKPLPPTTAASYVEQLAGALDAAHSAGLALRDITPSNILITPRGYVYLTHFAIGREPDDDADSGRPDVSALAGVLRQCTKPPTVLEAVIAKALAKDPAERYQTAQDFAAAAREALSRTARLRSAVGRRPKYTAPKEKPLKITTPASETAVDVAPIRTRTATKTQIVDNSDSGIYWNALWIVLLIAAAALTAIIVGLV
ncbi:MAG TPA: serine/threonine-protein kinase [Mycobacterium sp.]